MRKYKYCLPRYDKRFCTKGDLEHFSAGEHFSVVNIQGIECGFLISFDVDLADKFYDSRYSNRKSL